MQIPRITARQSLDTGRGSQPNLALVPGTEGVARVGQALEALGEAAIRQQEELEGFKAAIALEQFSAEVGERVAEARDAIEPGGTGFHAGMVEEFGRMRAAFLATVPDRLQPRYQLATERLASSIRRETAAIERDERYRFYREGVDERLAQLSRQVAGDPDGFGAATDAARQWVDLTGLPAVEKEKLKDIGDDRLAEEALTALVRRGRFDEARLLAAEAAGVSGLAADVFGDNEDAVLAAPANAARLSAEGLAVNEATLLLADRYGADQAAALLTADPEAPASGVIGVTVGETVGELISRAARDAPLSGQPADLTVLAEVEQAIAKQAQIEAAEAEQARIAEKDRLDLAIETGEIALPEEIIANPVIDDGDKAVLLRRLDARQGEAAETRQALAEFRDGRDYNRYDKADRKAINLVHEALSGGGIADEAALQTAAAIVERSGMVPDTVVAAIRHGLSVAEPAEAGRALFAADRLDEMSPGVFAGHEGREAIENAVSDYRHYRGIGFDTEEAATRVLAIRDPEVRRQRKALADQADERFKDLTPADVAYEFDPGLFSARPGFAGGLAETEVFMAYKDALHEAYIESGDKEIAKHRAKEVVERLYGESRVTGPPVLMRHPVERHYPPVMGGHEYFTSQLAEAVGDWAGMEIPIEDIMLRPVPQTDADVRAERPPGYAVVYRHEVDGIPRFDSPPGLVFRADIARARAEAAEAFAAERGANVDLFERMEKARRLSPNADNIAPLGAP